MAAVRRVAVALCAIALIGTIAPRALADTTKIVGTVAVAPCKTMEVKGSQTWCGLLERPWDPANPSLGTFPLAFSIVLPKSGVTTAPAVVGLEGGPGYGSIASGQRYADMLGPLMRDRALLVVDARGTGRSAPPKCPSLDSDLPWGRAAAECAERLGAKATLYVSALAADDLAALVGALGLGKVDVYGDSYGTFLAQVVASHHPEIVRTLMLDAAYPVTGETAWYPTMGHAMRTAFDTVCTRTPSCAKRAGSTMSRLRAVLDIVRDKPIVARAPSSGDGKLHTVTIDAPTLVTVAFNATYVTFTYQEMDASLRAALTGDWLPLGRVVASWAHDGSSGIGGTTYNAAESLSVSCHDYPQLFNPVSAVPERRAQVEAAVAAMKHENPGVYGPFTISEFRASDWSTLDDCTTWPAGGGSPLRAPGPPSGTYPDVPTLVLTGEFDTITTPAEGDLVARQFPRSRHVVVGNALHVVAGSDPRGCAPTLVRDFIANPTAVLAAKPEPCAEPLIRAAYGYPRTAAGLALPFAAAQTISDVLNSIAVSWPTEGYGLRGGSWSFKVASPIPIKLDGVKLYDDLPVSGHATWDYWSGDVLAKVVVRGESWTARWNSRTDGSQAVLTRMAGGPAKRVTFLAP